MNYTKEMQIQDQLWENKQSDPKVMAKLQQEIIDDYQSHNKDAADMFFPEIINDKSTVRVYVEEPPIDGSTIIHDLDCDNCRQLLDALEKVDVILRRKKE